MIYYKNKSIQLKIDFKIKIIQFFSDIQLKNVKILSKNGINSRVIHQN